MCVHPELREKNREKRARRWHFHRLRDSMRKLEESAFDPSTRSRKRVVRPNTQPSISPVSHDAPAFVTPDDLAAAAIRQRRREDIKDVRQFAREHPFAASNAV